MSEEVEKDLTALEVELDALDAASADIEREREDLEKERVIQAEVRKFKAASLDRASTSVFAVCLLAPALEWVKTPLALQTFDHTELLFALIVCGLAVTGLHCIASEMLRKGLEA